MDPQKFIEKAKKSAFQLWLFNKGMNYTIPFNKPHGFKVTKIEGNMLYTAIPYKKRNLNHIKGLHACALATLSEFTTGLFLISKLSFKKYRIILQRIEVDYLYQGKMDATAQFGMSQAELEKEVIEPLKHQEKIVKICDIAITDSQGNKLTHAKVHWQIKSWEKVKTKV